MADYISTIYCTSSDRELLKRVKAIINMPTANAKAESENVFIFKGAMISIQLASCRLFSNEKGNQGSIKFVLYM